MTEWIPDLDSQARVGEFVDEMLHQLLQLLGVDEIITSCEVVDTDPYGDGGLPRYIRVRIHQYYQDVLFRGGFWIQVGSYVHVVHIREGDRYEVLGIGGATGTTTITIESLGQYDRGYMIRGGLYGWEYFDASGDGYLLVGDGVDINSVPVSGDITLDSTGFVEVVGLRGYAIADEPPSDGDFLMWDSLYDHWEPNTIGPGYGSWAASGIGAAAVEILPAGSVTTTFNMFYVVAEEVGADYNAGSSSRTPGNTANILDDGANVCTYSVNVNGSVTVYRSAGAETYTLRAQIVWI